MYKKTSEGVVHGTGVYSTGIGSKGPALERFPDKKKKKKKKKNTATALPCLLSFVPLDLVIILQSKNIQ
jgi:hypothetical protein